MSEELLVRFCAPTLAGIKAASLFACHYDGRREMTRDLSALNHMFASKGIRIIPLREENGRYLLYMYRPDELGRCLSGKACREILRKEGYAGTSLGGDIGQLIRRFADGEEFPHEIGLFLDYPVEDVQGFIEHKGKDCKAVGVWKVYGDEESACRTFARYKQCTQIYSRQVEKGVQLSRLAVRKRR